MLGKIFLSAVLLTLVGCATTEPQIRIETKEVKVPVAIPCKTEDPVKPVVEFDKLRVEDNIEVKTKALLADRQRSIAYQKELEAALKSCK